MQRNPVAFHFTMITKVYNIGVVYFHKLYVGLIYSYKYTVSVELYRTVQECTRVANEAYSRSHAVGL